MVQIINRRGIATGVGVGSAIPQGCQMVLAAAPGPPGPGVLCSLGLFQQPKLAFQVGIPQPAGDLVGLQRTSQPGYPGWRFTGLGNGREDQQHDAGLRVRSKITGTTPELWLYNEVGAHQREANRCSGKLDVMCDYDIMAEYFDYTSDCTLLYFNVVNFSNSF